MNSRATYPVTVFVLYLLCPCPFVSSSLYSQPIRSLPLDTAVPTADTSMVPIALTSPITTRRTTIGNIRSGLTPTSRIITCTAPLLCAGTTSTTLASDFTLSITASSLFGFATISTPAGTSPVADSAQDTLTLICTAPFTCTGNSSTDTITLAPNTGWSDSGTTVALTTTSDKVAIGAGTPDAPLVVSGNSSTLQASSLAGTLIAHYSAADGVAGRILFDSYGGVTPAVDFRCAQGTAASPTAITSGMNCGTLTWSGRGATVYSTTTRSSIRALAAENWTDTAQGMSFQVTATPKGATAPIVVLTVDSEGHLLTSGTAPTVACTGTGTSPTAPTIAGTDNNFTIVMSTGTGTPGNTGTCTVTFAKAYATNKPQVVCMLQDGASAWSNESVIRVSTSSLTAPVLTWTNEATGVLTGLATSTSYQINCIVLGWI